MKEEVRELTKEEEQQIKDYLVKCGDSPFTFNQMDEYDKMDFLDFAKRNEPMNSCAIFQYLNEMS